MNDQGSFGVGITVELLNSSGSCFICRLAVEVMLATYQWLDSSILSRRW